MDWGIDFSSGGIIKNNHNVCRKTPLLGIYIKEAKMYTMHFYVDFIQTTQLVMVKV